MTRNKYYLSFSWVKKRPHNFRTKCGDSCHGGKNERKLYFESRIEFCCQRKAHLKTAVEKDAHREICLKLFPHFQILYICTKFGLLRRTQIWMAKYHKILIEFEDTFTFCNHGPITKKWPFYGTEKPFWGNTLHKIDPYQSYKDTIENATFDRNVKLSSALNRNFRALSPCVGWLCCWLEMGEFFHLVDKKTEK